MTKIENKSHLSNYKKILKLINTNNKNVAPFLPLIERFSFLDVHYSIKDLLNHYKWVKDEGGKGEIRKDVYSSIEDISENTFNIHALFSGWKIRAKQPIEYYFEELVCKRNYPPLKTCEELDYLIDLIAQDDNYDLHYIVRVTIEFKKALLRAYCLRNKIDLAPYIYK